MKYWLPWVIAAVAVAFSVLVILYSRSEMRRRENPAAVVHVSPTPYWGGPRLPGHEGTGAPERKPAAAADAGLRAKPQQAGNGPASTASASRAAIGTGYVAGVVLDMKGTPVPNASVTVFLTENGSQSKVAVYSDASGRFSASGLAAQQVDLLVAEAAGYTSAQLEKVPLPEGNVNLFLGRAAVVDLRVLISQGDGREPAPYSGEAVVYLMRQNLSEGSTSTLGLQEPNLGLGQYVTVNSQNANIREGGYSLPGASAGIYKVFVAKGNDCGESAPFQVDGNSDVRVSVTLGQKRKFEGFVRSQASQQPIGAAEVSLVNSGRPLIAGPAREVRARSDAGGHFQLENLVPGTYLMNISAAGYTTKTVEELSIPSGEENPPPGVYLLAEGHPLLSVSVFDGDGKPVPHAPLVLFSNSTPQPRSFFGKTDAAGVYRFETLPAGRYTLTATSPENRERQKNLEIVLADAESKAVEVRFLQMAKVSGTVRQKEVPCEGLISFLPRGMAGPKQFTKADAAGRFALELEPGEYVVSREERQGTAIVRIPREGVSQLDVSLK